MGAEEYNICFEGNLINDFIFSKEGFLIVSFSGTPMALQFLQKKTSPFPRVGKTLALHP